MIMPFSERVEADVDCASAISTLAYESIIPNQYSDPGRDPPPSIFVPPLEIVVSNEDDVPDWLRVDNGELRHGPIVERASLSPSSPTQGFERQISWESRCNDDSGPRLDEMDNNVPAFLDSRIAPFQRLRRKKSVVTVDTVAALGSLMSDSEDEVVEVVVKKERGSFFHATYVSVFHGRRRDVRLTRSHGLFT